MQEDLQDVRDMISVGASINVADYAGWTPLHEAVNRNNYDITEVLLKAGAQANCKGDDGVTPLLEAIQYQYYKIVDLLLKYGADPLLKCDRGKTPMDMITDRSMYMVVEKYLQKTKSDTLTADNSPRTTDSGVNPSVGQSRNQNPIRDTRPPLQKTKRTADESEHEGSVQCSAAEPVPGPSREQPNLEPSAQTSTNELFVRNQEQDFSSQGSLLLQDQESEGSDTSSCPDSELTMDYIEDRSSSPQHWTLCATQDFSATNIG
ncbi:ankyrin repeat domain-containing protein 31 isoform X4 [Danio rerio]|nr:novel protein (zgc:113046) [Danio rerio]